MARRTLLLTYLIASTAPAVAQPPIPRPQGSDNYFGTPVNQAFTPETVFPAKRAAVSTPVPKQAPVDVPPLAPPVILPVPPDHSGGLLPPRPAPPPPPLWSGSADLGLNGATGNSELFNMRIGALAARKTDENVFTTDFLYQLARQDGVTVARQALWNARDEVLFPGSPWTLFAALNLEYDELRDYDFRVGVYAGLGYTVVDDGDVTLKLRGGAGAVREFVTDDPLFLSPVALGVPRPADRWVPEFVFGYDFRYRLTDRSSLVSVLDYYPRIDDLTQFRVRVRAAYENVLDPETGMILRLGVQDRYDSNPGRAKKNDLSYFATLGIKF